MKNLAQLRASNALNFWHPPNGAPPAVGGANEGDVINKLPTLLRSAGLLSAVALAVGRGGYEKLFEEIVRFLTLPARGLLPVLPQGRQGEGILERFIRLLTEGPTATSHQLQIATDEAERYLEFLKSLAPPHQPTTTP